MVQPRPPTHRYIVGGTFQEVLIGDLDRLGDCRSLHRLNPCAGLVEDPGTTAGADTPRRWPGIRSLGGLGGPAWVPREAVLPEYRKWLFGQGRKGQVPMRWDAVALGFDPAAVPAVMAQGEHWDVRKCCDYGFVTQWTARSSGSRSFVDELFARHREAISVQSGPDGARPMRAFRTKCCALRLRVIT